MVIAAAVGGAAVLGAGTSVVMGNKAAKAAKKGADTAAANERYFYDTSRADFAPYREIGTAALGKLADMYGVPREVTPPANDMGQSSIPSLYGVGTSAKVGSLTGLPGFAGYGAPASIPGSGTPQRSFTPGFGGFQESPGYAFRRSEGLKAIDRSSAARGLLNSGATDKARMRYADGLASSEYDAYANRLAALAGVGQTATAQTTAAGQSAANGISQASIAAGNARASSYQNTGNAINSGLTGLAGAYLGAQTPKLPYNFGGF